MIFSICTFDEMQIMGLIILLHFKVYYKLDFREKKKKEENKDRPTQKPKQHCKVINNKVWYNFVLGVVKFEYYFGTLGLMQGQKIFSPSVFGGPVLVHFCHDILYMYV
jgi:hypothetical protein